MNIVMLLAGGIGSRMHSVQKKQHIVIEGHQIIEYTLQAFSACMLIDAILIVAHPECIQEIEKFQCIYPKLKFVISGGDTRIDSVSNGIVFLNAICSETDKVLISDAVRPCITNREVIEMLHMLDMYVAATTGVEVYETILHTEENVIKQITDRTGIYRQTSPEGYLFSELRHLYIDQSRENISKYTNIGIDQLCLELKQIGIVKSTPLNFKITTKDDLQIFQKVIQNGFLNFIQKR